MKLLTQHEMLELLPSTEEDRLHLVARLHPVVDDRDRQLLESGARERRHNFSTLHLDGEAVGCLWWFFSPANRTVVFKAGASFVKTNTTPAFIAAYDRIARSCGATSIELDTRRRGLVRVYQQYGFEITGVQMRKPVN